ncbi:unnamed protein product [Cyclocybe aegerita]|uniref:Uncharacterized protein n=1 Tax=Cyclocybe aegerita TaxID=1973307 RepID=A0A8S0WMP8_CYCAE|nr:unnamed protein product [Cyclocybe aegerita]
MDMETESWMGVTGLVEVLPGAGDMPGAGMMNTYLSAREERYFGEGERQAAFPDGGSSDIAAIPADLTRSTGLAGPPTFRVANAQISQCDLHAPSSASSGPSLKDWRHLFLQASPLITHTGNTSQQEPTCFPQFPGTEVI